MALVGRIFVILFALWLATMAAGIAFSIGFLGPQWPALSGDVPDRLVFWGAAFLASGITASLIFLPMLLAVIVAEALSIRSLLLYAAGGAVILLIAYFGADFGRSYEESIDAAPRIIPRGAELAAVAGMMFGLVYWLIAGRNAGTLVREQKDVTCDGMSRTGLLIALAIAAVVGGVFALFPQWDIAIARPFYEMVSGVNYFAMRIYPPLMRLRDGMLWLVTIVAVAPGLALLWKLLLPTRRLLIPARAIVFLVMTMALGPGFVTNVILKEHWGRPRPIDVQEFKGNEHFVAWWDPRGDCPGNCSFVSGDVSGAFWLLAPAALTPPPWRPLAYAGALVFGATMAGIRVAMGGHFFSDTVFAGIFTFLVIWLAYGAIYRWRRTRLTDEKLENALERMAMPGYRLVLGLFRRARPH